MAHFGTLENLSAKLSDRLPILGMTLLVRCDNFGHQSGLRKFDYVSLLRKSGYVSLGCNFAA
jgi:hypothetical protein